MARGAAVGRRAVFLSYFIRFTRPSEEASTIGVLRPGENALFDVECGGYVRTAKPVGGDGEARGCGTSELPRRHVGQQAIRTRRRPALGNKILGPGETDHQVSSLISCTKWKSIGRNRSAM